MSTYCVQCGKELGLEARFCSACGTPNAAIPPAALPFSTRLIRPRVGRVIAGVCQGIAKSYGWDVVWVRVIAVLAAVFSSGAGGIAYIIFWIVMPEELFALPASTTAYTAPPSYTGTTEAGK